MSKTAVSVAMATFNGERFLGEQLDSLARQTLLPLELVACDDGSTDGTLDILRRFQAGAPFPVRIHRNQMRLGAGFNFLNALGRCTGDLVAFCDQDDIWKEHKLSVCAEIMRDPGVALVSHSACVFSSQPSSRRWAQPSHRSCVWSQCRDLAVQSWQALGFSLVLRRTVLEKVPVPPYCAALSAECAYDLWACIAALSCGRVALLHDELALRRLHEGNVTLRPRRAGLARLAPDPRGLERGMENWTGLERFIRYAATFCGQPARADFGEHICRIERYISVCGERARLHRACGHRWISLRTVFSMLAKGDYSPRNLGAKAFLRDTFLAAFWNPRDNIREPHLSPEGKGGHSPGQAERGPGTSSV